MSFLSSYTDYSTVIINSFGIIGGLVTAYGFFKKPVDVENLIYIGAKKNG